MTAFCQPLPKSIAEGLLQVASRALCVRAGDTPEQGAARTRQMIYSILGFEPRDGLEYMLATMVVGHFHLILDSMHDVLWGQMDTIKARTKTSVVSLDRAMLGFVKEMRLVRMRPLARWAEEAQRQAEAAECGPVPAPAPASARDEVPAAGLKPEAAVAALAEAAGSEPAEIRRSGTTPAATVPSRTGAGAARPVAPLSAQVSAGAAAPDGAKADGATALSRAGTGAARPVAPLAAQVSAGAAAPDGTKVGGAKALGYPLAAADARGAAAVMHGPGGSPAYEVDATTAKHIAEFEAALAALAETLEEARARDGEKTEPKAASGD